MGIRGDGACLLFRTDNLPFDALIIVRSSASGTQAIHVVLDVVVAELTHLFKQNSQLMELTPKPCSNSGRLA